MATLTGSTGIAVPITLGAGTLSAGLQGDTGISVAVALGTSGAVLPARTRAFSIFIGGVDRTRWVADPSLDLSMQIGSRGTLRFVVYPKDGVRYEPAVWDEVIVLHNASGIRLFGGYVESTTRTDLGGTSGHYTVEVNCTDYGVITDRRLIAKWYTLAMGSFASIVAYDIHANFLQGTGITYDYPANSAGQMFGEVTFNWLTVSEALNQICEMGQLVWFITPYGELRLVDKAVGMGSAPFAVAPNNGEWRNLSVTHSKTQYWNKAVVRNNQDIAALWTDESVGGGYTIYTTYPQDKKPVVIVDGTELLVCAMADRGTTPGWQAYYIPGGNGVFLNQASAPLNSGNSIQVIYPSRVSAVVTAQDDASITEVGLWEHLEETTDATDPTALQALADGLLEQGKVIPTQAVIETDQPGALPGQLINITAGGLNGDYLIEQVTMSEVAKSYPRWRLQVSNAPQRVVSGAAFFAKMLRTTRQPVDRIDSNIAFVLAETIEGITNPGLSTGLKDAFRTARKAGYLKYARLHFGSVDRGTLTTQPIEVDVLKNGVSIFRTNGRLTYPVGGTGVQEVFYFATNPMPIVVGDVFTVNILQADSSACDGWLELQVQG